MNKKVWLNEAKQFIDSLSSEEFGDFLVSCDPFQVLISDLSISDIKIGKAVLLSENVLPGAANMDNFYSYDGNMAA